MYKTGMLIVMILYCGLFQFGNTAAQTIKSTYHVDKNGILQKSPPQITNSSERSFSPTTQAASSNRLYLSGAEKSLKEYSTSQFPGYHQDIDASDSVSVWGDYILRGDLDGDTYSLYIWALSPYVHGGGGQSTTHFRAEIFVNADVVATIDFSSSSSTISSGKRYTVTGIDQSTTAGDTLRLKISYRGGYGGMVSWDLGSGSYITIPNISTDFLDLSAPHVISSIDYGLRSVHAADLDNDGDLDVLSASSSKNKLAWHENVDGYGSFGEQKIISSTATWPYCVYGSDLDNDGDIDVLAAASGDDQIMWYENIDGKGTFGDQHIISTSTDEALCVYAADLDNDGDNDVLSASLSDDKIAWYENSDGKGTFGDQQIITTSANGACCVYAADLDNDGDLDILSASIYDDKIAWYENTDGHGTFGDQIEITTDANGARWVHASDLDNDGDMDVLSASSNDDKVAWYENTDGKGTFGEQQVMTYWAYDVRSVYAADLDDDGDMDVLSANYGSDNIAYLENIDGAGNFGPQQVLNTSLDGPSSVYACDIDNDGDKDILAAANSGDNLVWYSNLLYEPVPKADFAADTTCGVKPLTIQFDDRSAGTINTWNWDFGDEYSSSEQNPAHTYELAGTFTVSLTVKGPGGTNTKMKNNFIIVNEPSDILSRDDEIPTEYALQKNYPNPFNPRTTIKYAIPKSEHVVLKIYNINGAVVRTLVERHQSTGVYSITWDGKNDQGLLMPSGLYLYHLIAGSYAKTLKMALVK